MTETNAHRLNCFIKHAPLECCRLLGRSSRRAQPRYCSVGKIAEYRVHSQLEELAIFGERISLVILCEIDALVSECVGSHQQPRLVRVRDQTGGRQQVL